MFIRKHNNLKNISLVLLFAIVLNIFIGSIAYAWEECPGHRYYDYEETVMTSPINKDLTIEITNIHVHESAGGRGNLVGCNPHINVRLRLNGKAMANYHIWKEGNCYRVWESIKNKDYKECNKSLDQIVDGLVLKLSPSIYAEMPKLGINQVVIGTIITTLTMFFNKAIKGLQFA